MKLIVFLFCLLTSTLSFAKDEVPLCSLLHLNVIKQKIEPLPGIDKFKHCAASCLLALRCGPVDSYEMGLLKEFLDLLGMGTPDINDIKANMKGIRLTLTKEAINDKECINKCNDLYPDNQEIK